jgi:hypothetical protein
LRSRGHQDAAGGGVLAHGQIEQACEIVEQEHFLSGGGADGERPARFTCDDSVGKGGSGLLSRNGDGEPGRHGERCREPHTNFQSVPIVPEVGVLGLVATQLENA